MRKNRNKKENFQGLTVEDIRKIVRQEIETERYNGKGKPIERVLAEPRRNDMKRIICTTQRQATFTLEDDIESETTDSNNSEMRHVSEGENRLLDEAVVYELRAKAVESVMREIKYELSKLIPSVLESVCKRYQEAGNKDGISSIILLPLPQSLKS